MKKRILISALVKDVTGFLESVFKRCGEVDTEISSLVAIFEVAGISISVLCGR